MGIWVCPKVPPPPGWSYVWDLLAGPALPCLKIPEGEQKEVPKSWASATAHWVLGLLQAAQFSS